jgi:hypothetical protein
LRPSPFQALRHLQRIGHHSQELFASRHRGFMSWSALGSQTP